MFSIDNSFAATAEAAICDGRFWEAEFECKRLLALHERSSKPNDMAVVSCLHNLAQALEGQERYADGHVVRLRARDMLTTLMGRAS